MSDILRDRPFPIDLKVSIVFADVREQKSNARHETAKAFDEVRQHPRRMSECERPLRP